MRTPLLALGLLALMCSSAMAQSVGVASAVNQSATGLAPGQTPKTVYLGDTIIHNQKITTNGNGLLQILLADGTSFTVGPNSALTIDSFVYDPAAGTAKVVADLGTGLFRFIGGKSSKAADGVTLNTPVGTVGIQGGITNLDFSGATPFHIDMVYGVGVTLKDGTKVIGDLFHNGYSIVIDPNGHVGIQKTPPGWSEAFQIAMTGHGSSGKVNGTKVAQLGGTNKPGTTPSPDQYNRQLEINNEAQNPVTTWAQIDNSSLRGVTAEYDGTYSATGSYTVLGSDPNPISISGADFNLIYDFSDRHGTANFDVPIIGGVNVPVPVGPTDPTYARFGNSFTTNGYLVSGSGNISGAFNNNGGIGQGVTGTFGVDLNAPLVDSSINLNGTFGASYAGNVTPSY